MKNNKSRETAEYDALLKTYHKLSDRHVLVLETDMTYQDKCSLFHYADLVRKAGNELTGIIKKNYEQLVRTKQYRKLKTLYKKYKDKNDTVHCKVIAEQMNLMQKHYHVTWDDCRKAMIPIGIKYNLIAVTALTKSEDIWHGVQTCLYSDGETLHFAKYNELPDIRAKQINRGIVLHIHENHLRFHFNGMKFGVIIKDRFEQDEVKSVLKYLSSPETYDKTAVSTLLGEGTCISTYRPCYASLVCKKIRGKLRVYVHITIEGISKPKFDRNNNLKHRFGTGMIGCDIGTQTIAYTSDSEVGLKNLAERGSSIQYNERKERLLYRAMDRSRRATNPQNYNPDGTVKKVRKTWKYSNRYRKMKDRHTELCRINAVNRHLAINEDVNHIRSLGNIFITEPKNAKKLQRRSKQTTVNKNDRFNRKKRFGKSIQNRCCGYFQQQIKNKFTHTGGVYIEVPNDYRASQYDHTADEYIKKKLSDRMYSLSDGTIVQRDWYSSFLLYNADYVALTIDKNKCHENFAEQYQKEKTLIEQIKANNIKILNSGIKIS